jgi:hypothetical protein
VEGSDLALPIFNLTCVDFPFIIHFPTVIPLSGVGTTCFSSCCDKDSAIILRPAACLTSLLGNGVGGNDCKWSRDHWFNVPSEAGKSSS